VDSENKAHVHDGSNFSVNPLQVSVPNLRDGSIRRDMPAMFRDQYRSHHCSIMIVLMQLAIMRTQCAKCGEPSDSPSAINASPHRLSQKKPGLHIESQQFLPLQGDFHQCFKCTGRKRCLDAAPHARARHGAAALQRGMRSAVAPVYRPTKLTRSIEIFE
jgi:hypothetical protein